MRMILWGGFITNDWLIISYQQLTNEKEEIRVRRSLRNGSAGWGMLTLEKINLEFNNGVC